MKAKTFINDSVARVREVSLSQVPVSPIQERSLAEKPIRKPLPSWMLFAREVFRNPRALGTPCESSMRLARAIANFVPLSQEGLIVELGAGTGKVTEALLQHGVAPEQLVSVELSPAFADYLQRHFSHVRIIRGDALHLQDLLGNDCQRVSTIVSGLPLRSIPHMRVHGILKQISEILPKDGTFIQFTYDLTGRATYLPYYFKRVSHKIVWSNLPPARINKYQFEP